MPLNQEEIARTPAEVRLRHCSNRLAWNEAAACYTEEIEQTVRNLRDRKSSLHPIERRNLVAGDGPLIQWCRRAIHLQCAGGYDTMSLLLEGAHEVIGVDISDLQIDNARRTAEQLSLPARWYCCDVLDTPAELDGSADLVYTGQGALCWLHDLPAWAAVIARLLRPGGILSLLDDHPASWLFSCDAETIQASGISYFGYAEFNQGWSAEYIGDLGKPESEHAVKHERLWTIADVFQALTGAGLSVEYFGEHPDEYWRAFPRLPAEERIKLPMTFSMIAQKPLPLPVPE